MSKQVMKATRISNIKINDIEIGTKKVNRKVTIQLYNKHISIQTPFLEVCTPLQKTSVANLGQLDTLFKGESDKKINQWSQFIEDLEKKIFEHSKVHGINWFTHNDIKMKSLIREQEAHVYIKWPISLEPNVFVDEKKQSFAPSNIRIRDLVKIIFVPELCVDKDQFGLIVNVQKIMVKPFVDKVQCEYVFDESESDHDMPLLSEQKPAPNQYRGKKKATVKKVTQQIEDYNLSSDVD